MPTWRSVTSTFLPSTAQPIDPYLVWADVSDWRGFGGRRDHVTVMVETAGPLASADPDVLHAIAANPLNAVSIAGGSASRFATIRYERGRLTDLQDAVQSGALARFQLGVARSGGDDVPGSREIDERLIASLLSFHTLAEGGDPPPLDLTLCGVVDDGCCLAHERFRLNGSTLFLFVWDQGSRGPGGLWQKYQGVNYGSELAMVDIEAALTAQPATGEAGERWFYASVLDRADWGSAGRTHGAGVLHRLLHTSSPNAFLVRPVLFVQLPRDTVADSSGGSIGVRVLDGVRYIVSRARTIARILSMALTRKVNLRLTVNVSLGSLAGPHDGSTMTERALAELGALQELDIVLAAGNSAAAKLHSIRDLGGGLTATFDLVVPPMNERETYLEVWLPCEVDVTTCAVSVRAPGGVVSSTVHAGDAMVVETAGLPLASIIFCRRCAQGEDGTMILLAIGATARPAGSDASVGVWSLTVSSTMRTHRRIHGWVERNDVLIGGRRPQQSRFIGDTDPESTLSSIANGECVTVVGASDRRLHRRSDYSSRGPTLGPSGVVKPDLYAESDESSATPGVLLPGFFSGSTMRLSGTSVAAPRVARWILEGSRSHEQQPTDDGQGGQGVAGS